MSKPKSPWRSVEHELPGEGVAVYVPAPGGVLLKGWHYGCVWLTDKSWPNHVVVKRWRPIPTKPEKRRAK